MTEVNTFSAAVDDTVARGGRPDRRTDVVSYVRQTLRECQVMAFFSRDFTEDQIVSNATPFLWDVPQEFRQMRTVRYQMFDQRGQFIYPEEGPPGRLQREKTYYYYRGVDYFVFAGVSNGTNIDLAYYSYFKKLPYYEVGARPAVFSLETNAWTYLSATTDAEKEAARALVSNWILFDWYDLILEGSLAKLYKTVQDPRANSTFGLYKSLQKDLLAGEASVSLGM